MSQVMVPIYVPSLYTSINLCPPNTQTGDIKQAASGAKKVEIRNQLDKVQKAS